MNSTGISESGKEKPVLSKLLISTHQMRPHQKHEKHLIQRDQTITPPMVSRMASSSMRYLTQGLLPVLTNVTI